MVLAIKPLKSPNVPPPIATIILERLMFLSSNCVVISQYVFIDLIFSELLILIKVISLPLSLLK